MKKLRRKHLLVVDEGGWQGKIVATWLRFAAAWLPECKERDFLEETGLLWKRKSKMRMKICIGVTKWMVEIETSLTIHGWDGAQISVWDRWAPLEKKRFALVESRVIWILWDKDETSRLTDYPEDGPELDSDQVSPTEAQEHVRGPSWPTQVPRSLGRSPFGQKSMLWICWDLVYRVVHETCSNFLTRGFVEPPPHVCPFRPWLMGTKVIRI